MLLVYFLSPMEKLLKMDECVGMPQAVKHETREILVCVLAQANQHCAAY